MFRFVRLYVAPCKRHPGNYIVGVYLQIMGVMPLRPTLEKSFPSFAEAVQGLKKLNTILFED